MTKYLISSTNTRWTTSRQRRLPDVAKTSHAVAQEAKDAGVFVFAGGLDEDVDPVWVAGDGSVTAATYPLGGMTIIDVPSRDEALKWAARFAVGCRCAQEVSAFQLDPLA